MAYTDVCPPCGQKFSGEDREQVITAVIEHARDAHDHALSREHVLAHIAGKDPHANESN